MAGVDRMMGVFRAVFGGVWRGMGARWGFGMFPARRLRLIYRPGAPCAAGAWLVVRLQGARDVSTNWLSGIEQHGDATLGAGLIRLARQAAAMHQDEMKRAADGAATGRAESADVIGRIDGRERSRAQ